MNISRTTKKRIHIRTYSYIPIILILYVFISCDGKSMARFLPVPPSELEVLGGQTDFCKQRKHFQDSIGKCKQLYLIDSMYLGMSREAYKKERDMAIGNDSTYMISGYPFKATGRFYDGKLYCLILNRDYTFTITQEEDPAKYNADGKDTIFFYKILSYLEHVYGTADRYTIGERDMPRKLCTKAEWLFKELYINLEDPPVDVISQSADGRRETQRRTLYVTFCNPSIKEKVRTITDSLFETGGIGKCEKYYESITE